MVLFILHIIYLFYYIENIMSGQRQYREYIFEFIKYIMRTEINMEIDILYYCMSDSCSENTPLSYLSHRNNHTSPTSYSYICYIHMYISLYIINRYGALNISMPLVTRFHLV